jgi:hypothetical protein
MLNTVKIIVVTSKNLVSDAWIQFSRLIYSKYEKNTLS